MKTTLYFLISVGLIFAVTAEPTCNFKFENDKYVCPLSNANIEADTIGGKHDSKGDEDVEIVYADEAVKEFIFTLLFNRFKNLKEMEFRKGSLSTLSQEFFFNCLILQKILIKQSPFVQVPESTFAACPELKEIDLGSNNINDVHSKAFAGLGSLTILRLNENDLSTIKQNVFSPLENLQILDLSKNYLKLLDANAFASNKVLSALYLAENKFDRLVTEYFSALKELTLLDLTKNGVNSTAKSMVENLVGLQTVKFKENNCINKDFENFAEADLLHFETCIANFNAAPILILSNIALVLTLVLKIL